MDKLAQELEAMREQLVPVWDEERSARIFSGVGQLRRRRTAARVGMATLTAAAAAVVVLLAEPTAPPAGEVAHHVQTATGDAARAPSAGDTVRAGRLRLADGSTAGMVGEHSELELLQNAPGRIAMRLHQGQVHFDVVPNAERSFAVESGPYRVVVLGTVFDVIRTTEEVLVEVSRGKVRVYGPSGAHDVSAGERQAFPLEPGGQVDEAAEQAAPDAEPDEDAVRAGEPGDAMTPAKRERRPRVRQQRGENGWRSLSQSGDYDAAYRSLQAGGGQVEDDPSALMDAADAARLSGHPRSAVKYLERVVSDHRGSPVAPLAAFTLGRVYLDRLGHPHKAAQAFGRSRTLSPAGSLAQDALAREVEALSKGGDAQGAYERAQEYLRRYPSGRRVRAVQLYGGIE